MHWTEKARRLSPIRFVLQIGLLLYPMLLGAIAYGWCGPLSHVVPKVDALLVMVAAFAGAFGSANWIGSYLLRVHDFPPRTGWSAELRIFLALVPLLVSYGVVLFVQPRDFAAAVLLDAVALACLIGSIVRGLTLRRWLGIARPAGERLRRIVEATAARMGLPPPPAFELQVQLANAFAFTFERSVAVTTGALAILSDAELATITSHEIAHLQESPAAQRVRLVMPIVVFLVVATAIRSHDASTFIFGYFAVVAVWLWVTKKKRALEKEADKAGAHHQEDAGLYALALLKLYQANLFPAATKRAGTHPMLYDRLVAAGATPGFPRPRPPAFGLGWVWMIATTIILVRAAMFKSNRTKPPTPWELAMFGGNVNQFQLLADAAHAQGNTAAELDLVEASVEAEPSNEAHRFYVIRSLALQGECDRATRVAEAAQTRQAEVSLLLTICRTNQGAVRTR